MQAQRAMSVLIEQKAAVEVQAAAMEEEVQVQLVVVEVRAEDPQAQTRDLGVQVGELMAAAALRAEAHHAELSKSIEAIKTEGRRADIAEAQALQVQGRLATATWRLGEREEQRDSCYNELVKSHAHVQELERHLLESHLPQGSGGNLARVGTGASRGL